MEPPPNPPQRGHQGVLTTLPALLTAIAAIVTAVAGLGAVLLRSGDSNSERALTREPTAVVAGSATPTATSSPSPTATAVATATPRARTTAVATGVWPSERSAYTVVLASVKERGEAEALAAEARGNLPTVGVLRSGDHPGLRAGYWVVFSGSFDGRSNATRNATDARSAGFVTAYVRWLQGE